MEKERHRLRKWHKGSKVAKRKIDREETLTVNRDRLSADAEFKGHESVVVQDIRVSTDEQALCRVHEGRHYKIMTPFIDHHRRLPDDFQTKFWRFYHQLQLYRASPTPE